MINFGSKQSGKLIGNYPRYSLAYLHLILPREDELLINWICFCLNKALRLRFSFWTFPHRRHWSINCLFFRILLRLLTQLENVYLRIFLALNHNADMNSVYFYKILSVEKSYTFLIRSFSLESIKTAIHKKLVIIFILWNLENFYQIL